MRAVEVSIEGVVEVTSEYFCEQLLKLERWSEFTGYKILPGIRSARFIHFSEEIVGTRVQVINTDGTSHEEEILEWKTDERVKIQLSHFVKPLQYFTSHFIEEFRFVKVENGTKVTRIMKLYPSHLIGRLFLLYLSRYMRKALEIQAKIRY